MTNVDQKEQKTRAILLSINIALALVLTLIALYNPMNVETKFLGFPSGFAPIVYLVVLWIFSSDAIKTPKYTFVNVGVFILATVLLLIPLPEGAQAIKWWYPLTAGLLIGIFV